jgi:hypothetical protein
MHGTHSAAATKSVNGDTTPPTRRELVLDWQAEKTLHNVTAMAMGGDVDFPMLYMTLNSCTRTFTGATLRVGTPAWLKHAMNPVGDVLANISDTSKIRTWLDTLTRQESCANDAHHLCGFENLFIHRAGGSR